MDFDILAIQEVNWSCDDKKGQMNWLLDLDSEDSQIQEFRLEFQKTYTAIFPTEDTEFQYDGLAMYVNKRILKDFIILDH